MSRSFKLQKVEEKEEQKIVERRYNRISRKKIVCSEEEAALKNAHEQ